MPDREYKIKILTVADNSGGRAASETLDQVKKSATGEGEALKEAGKNAEQATLSHHALHGIARELHHEFPLLGHVMHAALNPAALAIAGIIGAFEIWKHRVEEMTNVLVGFTVPDNSPFSPRHMDALTTAWNSFDEAIRKATEEYGSVDKAADRANKTFEASVDRMKKLHPEMATQIDNDAELVRRKMDLAKASALEADAQQKMVSASKIKVATAEEDAKTEDQLKKAAEEARKSGEEHRQNRLTIAEASQGTFAERLKLAPWYLKKYGNEMEPKEAMRLEREAEEAAQIPQRRLRDFEASKADRDRARAMREELTSGAAKEAGQAAGIRAAQPGPDQLSLESSVNAYEAAAQGQKLSESQVRGLGVIQGALRAAGNNQQQIVALLEEMRDLHVSHAAKIQDLQIALGRLEAQVHSTVNP